MSMQAARARRNAARARALEPSRLTPKALRCRKTFLRYFPQGYQDETFVAWERDYKANACVRFEQQLGGGKLRELVERGQLREAARLAVAIEARTNLLFSFEKMALRDAVGTPAGARLFTHGLLELVEGGVDAVSFHRWCETVSRLPRRQTRVSTLAGGDRLRLHRATRGTRLPEADRHPSRPAGVWLRFSLLVAARLGHLRQPARLCAVDGNTGRVARA